MDTRPERRERRKQRTRLALIDAARTLFAERGYAATTIAAIAERAELGFGTFYLYFQDKDAMLQAIIVEGLDGLAQELDESAPPGGGDALMHGLFAYAYRNRELFQILIRTSANDALDVQAIFRDRLSRRLGIGGDDHPSQIQARFLAGVVAQAIMWWFDHDAPSPDEMADMAERFILFGMFGGVRDPNSPA